MHSRTNEILSRVRKMIQEGEFASGFLPSERELCEELDISRGTLRAIYRNLEDEKLIRRIPGRGMKVLSIFERVEQHKILLVLPSKGIRATETASILQGAATAAEEENAELVLFFQDKNADCSRLAARIHETPWDGVVFVEDFPHAIIKTLDAAKCRYCIANYEEGEKLPACRVDFRAVGRVAGGYLVKKGFRRIGFIGGGAKCFHYHEMLAGLKGALAEEDLRVEEGCVFNFEKDDDAKNCAVIAKALEGHVGERIAFFAGRDHWARPLYRACRSLSLGIPDDVAVIGYDGLSWEEAAVNGLSTIMQPALETGAAAVHAICNGDATLTADDTVLLPPGQLIERNSVEKRSDLP